MLGEIPNETSEANTLSDDNLNSAEISGTCRTGSGNLSALPQLQSTHLQTESRLIAKGFFGDLQQQGGSANIRLLWQQEAFFRLESDLVQQPGSSFAATWLWQHPVDRSNADEFESPEHRQLEEMFEEPDWSTRT